MARQFGIITTTTGVTSVVVTSFSKAEKAEIAEARDSHGKVTDLKAYSKETSVTIKGLLDAASCDAAAGSTITVGGTTYLIESVTVSETNTNFAEVDITAKIADSAATTAYSAT